MSGAEFGALQAQVREVMERHHPELARWDRDMTADGADAATATNTTGGSSSGEEGVLPTLRAAEDTLLRAEARCARVDRLLTLQEVRLWAVSGRFHSLMTDSYTHISLPHSSPTKHAALSLRQHGAGAARAGAVRGVGGG